MDALSNEVSAAHSATTDDEVEQIDRSIDLDLEADELWELVSTADGWSRWLTETADLDVEPGAVGDVTDGQATKRVRVDAVEPRRRIGFTWWTDADPSDAATVELRIEDVSVTARRLHIVERRLLRSMTAGAALGRLSSSAPGVGVEAASLDRQLVWETRLWLLGSHVPARMSMSMSMSLSMSLSLSLSLSSLR